MFVKYFLPDYMTALYVVLLVIGLIVLPWLSYEVCHLTGRWIRRMRHGHKNWGNLLGLLTVPIIWYIVIYGVLFGFQKMEVNQLEYHSKELPAAFDGYRIVLFSDAHVGTLSGHAQWMLQRAVDSINAQKADLIVFAGDLQNAHPKELYEHQDLLVKLKAKDGVYAVLGNHDYASYQQGDDALKIANCRETQSLERQMGWTLLMNEHRTIARNGSRLVIAGMENDGDGSERRPQKGDLQKTLQGVNQKDFILLLEHDPSSWRRRIIPDGRAQLTLAGHTHGSQFGLFGWSPIALFKREWKGFYQEGRQSLFITAGVGALVPWRFGQPGEIVVITLRSEV